MSQVVQMGLRGIAFILMVAALFYNSEYPDLTTANHFFTCGVYGSYAIISLGLLIEAGLQIEPDKVIEVSLLALGVFLNVISAVLSFMDYQALILYRGESIIKGFVSVFSLIVYIVDMTMIICG